MLEQKLVFLEQKLDFLLFNIRAASSASPVQACASAPPLLDKDTDSENSVDVWGVETKDVRPLIRTETHTDGRGRNPRTATHSTPYSGLELGDLQTRFSGKPGETETEYLWRVSLTGGGRILLSKDEATGFWGPGVFLSDGPDGDQSITSRVAYWAGDIDPRERGEPVAIVIKGLSDLAEGVQKAACIQAMYERGRQSPPMAAPVDSVHLRLLIKGLLDALKIYVQSLKEEIQGAIDRNKQNTRSPPEHVLTWVEILHNVVTHGREMGWVDPSGSPCRSRTVRKTSRAEPLQGPPPTRPPPPRHRNRSVFQIRVAACSGATSGATRLP